MKTKKRQPAEPYHWMPGQGADPAAFQRLVQTFRRPPTPMGEAWFMSEKRKMYDGLMAPDPHSWSEDELSEALYDIGSGPFCFGHMDEWSRWFPYLLHATQPLIGEWRPLSPFGALVSAVMVHCPDSDVEPYYEGFYDDMLNTLGRLPMDAANWSGGGVLPGRYFSALDKTVNGLMLSGTKDFSAAFFLAAKYLHPDQIARWLESVIAIDNPFWRGSFLLWLSRSAPFVVGCDRWPHLLDWHSGGWDNTSSVTGTTPNDEGGPEVEVACFLGPARQKAFSNAINALLDQALLNKWRLDLDSLQSEAGELYFVMQEFDEASTAVVSAYGLR
jgi:hypothetical protein